MIRPQIDAILYRLGRAAIVMLQALPLVWVARLGRLGGGVAFYLDRRHRRVALQNLTLCFGKEKTPGEIYAIARENFRRIGENYVCAVKTAGMTFEQLKPHLVFSGFENFIRKIDAASQAEWPEGLFSSISAR